MKIVSLLGLGFLSLSFVGSAYADMRPVGPDQEIRINTVDEKGKFHNSHCFFENAAGAKTIVNTEMTHIFVKSGGKTQIHCESTDGIWHGAVEVRPSMDTSIVGVFSLPWTGMVAGTAMLSGGSSRSDTWVSSAVVLPDVINVPMSSDIQTIAPASYADDEDALKNAPPETVTSTSYSGKEASIGHHRHIKHHSNTN